MKSISLFLFLLIFTLSFHIIIPMHFIDEESSSKLNNNFFYTAKSAFNNDEATKYFDTKSLKNRNWQTELLEKEQAKEIELETADNIKIQGYFIDRGSNKAILVGHGFLESCKVLIPFFKLFPDYDLLIINYRWDNWHSSLRFPSGMLNNPLDKYIFEAKDDVIAAVKFLRDSKRYETITGLGLCYSGLVYTIAQAMVFSQENEELLFDKLIIDSSYFSTEEVANSVIKDPILCCENKDGGAPNVIQSVLSIKPISKILKLIGNTLIGEQYEQLSMAWYLPMIASTPIMFIHGKNDLLVPYKHLKKMLEAAQNTPHCALVTEHEHVLNHIKSKEAYAYLSKMFIESSSIKNFSSSIKETFIDSSEMKHFAT